MFVNILKKRKEEETCTNQIESYAVYVYMITIYVENGRSLPITSSRQKKLKMKQSHHILDIYPTVLSKNECDLCSIRRSIHENVRL